MSKQKYMVIIAGSDLDEFYTVPTWVQMGDAVLTKKDGDMVGGCVLNVGVVASALGLTVFDVDCLNDTDPGTNLLLEHMQKWGIHTDFVKQIPEAQNGKCLIFNCQNERTIFVIDAVFPRYGTQDTKLQELLNGADIIYSMPSMCAAVFGPDLLPLKEAKQHGAKIVFDGSSHYALDHEIKNIALADAVVMNNLSLGHLQKKIGPDAVEQLLNQGVCYLCETLGPDGVIMHTTNGDITCPSIAVDVVDSTGAGDTFIASFIYGWSQGWSGEKIAKFATAAGARACTRKGGTGGAGTAQDILDFAKQHGVVI